MISSVLGRKASFAAGKVKRAVASNKLSGVIAMAKNVLGTDLKPCSMDPMTGFFRDGCCNTDDRDHGQHVVCARMTDEFLQYSRQRGNDLITPRPEFGFPGLKDGDQWCVCAGRWEEARQALVAPPVVLESTHESAAEIVSVDALKAHALRG